MDNREKLEEAKRLYETANADQKYVLERLFPELGESEDERIRKALIQNLKERFGIKGNMGEGLDMPDVLDWFEKQGEKDKLIKELGEYKVKYTQEVLSQQLEKQGEQKSTEWSEEDEEAINLACSILYSNFNENENFDKNQMCIGEIIEKLKSLKDRVGCEVNCTTTKEWSEDDENRFRNLIYLVEHSDDGKATKEGFIKFINRLKSLRPQNTWKPSDEQLEYLVASIEESNENPVLESLYQDLKKLREE